MEETIKAITLEDGIQYAIIDELIINDIKYVFLSNIDDSEDFCIRKVLKENEEEFLVGLEDDSEFDLALMHFAKNNKEEMNKIS